MNTSPKKKIKSETLKSNQKSVRKPSTIDYNAMKVVDLKNEIVKRGLTIDKKMLKKDLILLLQTN